MRKSADLQRYMAIVFDTANKHGWKSRGQAYLDGSKSTAELAEDCIDTHVPTGRARIEAHKALEWIKSSFPKNDYMLNLQELCMKDRVSPRDVGVVASLYYAYRTYLEQQSSSEYQGNVGDSLTVTITVDRVVEAEGRYGLVYLHVMNDCDGNQYLWPYHGVRPLDVGGEYELSCTVKDFREYNGVKQTVVKSCREVE